MAKQIIVTQNNYGILLETQFIDDAKNPVDLTGYSVTVEFEYLEKCFDVLDATIINAEEGRVGVILEQKHTAEIGLYKTQWSVVDYDENVTAQEDIYYFVKKEVAMEEEEKEELGTNIDTSGIIEKFKDLDANVVDIRRFISNVNNKKINKNYKHSKSIFMSLPLKLQYHQEILNTGVGNYIYPQSFTMEEESKHIYILYAPDSGTPTRWIAVYDFDGKYITTFGAGSAGGEGIVVKIENRKKYLYVKTEGSKLGKFDISILPEPLTVLSPIREFEVGLYSDFCYKDGVWLIEQEKPSLGSQKSRTNISMYDDDFRLIGQINTNREVVGLFTTDSEQYLPKRQGMDIGKDYIYQACGGIWLRGTKTTPFTYYGIKTLNKNGTLNSDNLYDPEAFANIIEAKTKLICRRIENEGVYVSSNGDIYTMCVIENRDNATWDKQGIIIFKEFSSDDNAIDFSSATRMTTQIDLKELERGSFPRANDGASYNPLNGQKFEDINQIIKFMQDLEMKRFCFYTSSITIKDIDGTNFPTGYYATIENTNNLTFIMTLEGFAGVLKYCYYGADMSEANRKKRLIQGEIRQDIELQNEVTDYNPASPAIAVNSNGIVTLDGTLANVPANLPVTLGKLPTDCVPKEYKNILCCLSGAGQYGVLQITKNGNINLVYRSSASEHVILSGVTYVI